MSIYNSAKMIKNTWDKYKTPEARKQTIINEVKNGIEKLYEFAKDKTLKYLFK